MAEISDAITMIKKAESDAEQLIVDSQSQSKELIDESNINATFINNTAKQGGAISLEQEACHDAIIINCMRYNSSMLNQYTTIS